jgi:hypothetical protein
MIAAQRRRVVRSMYGYVWTSVVRTVNQSWLALCQCFFVRVAGYKFGQASVRAFGTGRLQAPIPSLPL